jgi:hypothetical protein
MSFTQKNLPPVKVCDSYTNNDHNTAKMWQELGAKTIRNIAESCRVMAILWQRAWKEGKGDANFTSAQMAAFDGAKALKPLYENKAFVPSYRMNLKRRLNKWRVF